MGHTTLGVLPKTRYWKDVAALLAGPGPSHAIFAASAQAAEKDLLRATDDPVFIEAVRLLLAIPAAARAQDFGDALRAQGMMAPDQPDVLDIAGGRHTTARSGTGRTRRAQRSRRARRKSPFGHVDRVDRGCAARSVRCGA
jgi:hypothetical protein